MKKMRIKPNKIYKFRLKIQPFFISIFIIYINYKIFLLLYFLIYIFCVSVITINEEIYKYVSKIVKISIFRLTTGPKRVIL